MTDLAAILLPILLLVALGFVARRAGLVADTTIQSLGAFVLHFALPALILHALVRQDLRQVLNWNYLIAYGGGSLVAFATILLAMRALKKPAVDGALAALGASASNSGFVGFPVASLALGAPALTALPLTMLVENIVILPLAFMLAEMAGQRGKSAGLVARATFTRLSRTPLLLAILVGVLLSALNLHLPGPLATALGMMANASVPAALFVVGGTLAAMRVERVDGEVMLIVAGKLVLHPLAVTLIFVLVGGVPAPLMAAGIVLASAPMLTIYPILGARYGYAHASAVALFAATALSFVTLSVVLSVLLRG